MLLKFFISPFALNASDILNKKGGIKMQTVDARGLDCPKPVILTKKALSEMSEGSIETIVDNEVAKDNLNKLANSLGYDFEFNKVSDKEYRIVITIVKSEDEKKVRAEVEDNSRSVIMIAQDRMGEDKELGKILIKSLFYTIRETTPFPEAILFYNTGVRLTCEGSEIIEDIKFLEDNGVRIISCGTCLDFLKLKEDLRVGEIGNMYLIYETALNKKVISIG